MIAAPPTLPADARPVIVEEEGRHLLLGARCRACGHASARQQPRCSRCRSETTPARFGPEGTVWAVTILHVASDDREVPYTLAYVDLDEGPRLLVHVVDASGAAIGDRVRVVAATAAGDPAVETLA